MNRTSAALAVLGVANVVVGVGLASLAAGLVVLGLALVGAAWLAMDVGEDL